MTEAYTVTKMLESINSVMAPVAATPQTTVALKRKLDNGVMLDTSPQEIALLDLQAKVKHAAQQVACIPSSEKRHEWVRDKRLHANAVFQLERFQEAAELYVEALAGLEFGDSPERRRECELHVQVPLTCNLVACLLRLEQWEKALRVAEQALAVAPAHGRALSQRAKALMKLGRTEEARSDLRRAIEEIEQDDMMTTRAAATTMPSLDKLRRQMEDVDRAEIRERQRKQHQRRFQQQMMREAVGRLYEDKATVVSAALPAAEAASRDASASRDETETTRAVATLTPTVSQRLVRWLASVLLIILQLIFGKLEKHE